MLPGHRRLLAPVVSSLILGAGCGSGGPGLGAPSPVGVPTPAPTPAPAPVIVTTLPIGQTRPADLTIGSIQRLPTLDYVFGSADPTSEGWPAPGRTVTWRAHLRNWADFPLPAVDYSWILDGMVVESGTRDLAAGEEGTVDFRWAWDPRRHELELLVDRDHRFTVPRGPMNRLLVHTDALSVAFYVEEAVERHFRAHQYQLGIGSSSFEDWAQRQIRFYNDLLEKAVYPETPQGVRDRLRLDKITRVSDGALPLVPVDTVGPTDQRTFAAFRPNAADRTVDLQWGFPSSVVGDYQNHTSLSTINQSYYSGYVQHEMGHVRSLIDTHFLNVFHGPQGGRIDILEGGVPVAGTRYMPGTPIEGSSGSRLRVHRANHRGLMDSDWTFMDRYAAGAWNRISGRRATRGNFFTPENLGDYLEDLPAQNRLTLRDGAGTALAGALVRIFQTGGSGRIFDNVPDLERIADDQGQVLLGRNPFSPTGRIGDVFANGVAIVRVEHRGHVGYGFLEVADFNLAYWAGHVDFADHELRVALF